jgi:putative transposase
LRQRRLSDIDTVVLSLTGHTLTSGEISAHFAEVYGASMPADTITRITDTVLEQMAARWPWPLERAFAAIFVDVINVKARDGQVGPKPFYAAIGVDLDGRKDILAMSARDGDGESAKYWMSVLTDIRNLGVHDAFFVVCDWLKGLPDAVNAVWPDAVVQTRINRLIRNSFRYVSRKSRDSCPGTCDRSTRPAARRRPCSHSTP